MAGDEVWELAAAEYRRMLELLRTLGEGDWTRPTAWGVRAMLGHLVGAVVGFANPREMGQSPPGLSSSRLADDARVKADEILGGRGRAVSINERRLGSSETPSPGFR